MFIAEDLIQFKKLFVSKLKGMLADDELGAFILVLANSHQDEYLRNELRVDLNNTFLALKDNYASGNLKAPQDDVDVFAKLLSLELDNVVNWQNKTIGEWEITYNAMRQLRPARASSQILNSIKQPFDESRFHFNKPFLKPEILWQGEYNGLGTRVLFNKFPFSDYHLLIVVSPEKNCPQLLSKEMHEYASSLVTKMSKILPGFGIGFNSLAAGASVNHFHFQGFVREEKFSVEKDRWSHNSGKSGYPLQVERFSGAESSWRYIEQLTEADVAFNCLYRNNYCYVVQRAYQGAVETPNWLVGAGWIDVAGAMTVSDEKTYDLIEETEVTQALKLLLIS